MNKLDNFFKEKLSGYSIAPRNEVWTKVESGLPKKNSKAIWLKLAAGLVIFAFGISMWVASQKNQVDKQRLSSTEAMPMPEIIDKEMNEKQIDVSKQKARQVVEVDVKKNTAVPQKEESKSNQSLLAGTINKNKEESEDHVVLNETVTLLAQEEAVIEIPTLSNEGNKSVAKPIVIEYTLAAVNVPSRESENEVIVKKTGFKKVLEIAGEVRSGEGGLSGLRQAKNEILAFNFIKDKEDRNNK